MMVLAEALQEGKAHSYMEYIFIPQMASRSHAMMKGLLCNQEAGLESMIIHTGSSELVSAVGMLAAQQPD